MDKYRLWDKVKKQYVPDSFLPCYHLRHDGHLLFNKRGALLCNVTDRYVVEFWTGDIDIEGVEIYDGDLYKDAQGIISRVWWTVSGWDLREARCSLYYHNVCEKTRGKIIGTIHDAEGDKP